MLKIITTADGSHSLWNETFNETYHSVHGAIQESAHVFIRNGLAYLLERNPSSPISIFEVGFGTGLNALLTFQHLKQHPQTIHYTSVELSPLPEEIWSNLNYAPLLGVSDEYRNLHQASWGNTNFLTPNFHLLKLNSSLEQVDLRPQVSISCIMMPSPPRNNPSSGRWLSWKKLSMP